MHKIVTSVATLGICLSLTLSVSLLHAQQRPAKRMLAAGLELHRASLSPTRLNQLKLNKARADLPKLRALFSVGPQGVPLYRLADRQQVKLLKPHSGAPFRSISSAQAPASLSRYNDYVQGKPNAAQPPARISLKARQSEVQNQLYRGTCAAFALVAMLEASYKGQGVNVNLSEQDVFSTLVRAKGQHPCLDDGSYVGASTLTQVVAQGVSAEADWPYVSSTGAMGCSTNPWPKLDRPARAAQNNVWGLTPDGFISVGAQANATADVGSFANNPRQIEAWLASGYEVYLAVGVANELDRSGLIDVVLDADGEPLGSVAGHAMLVVGYDKSNGGSFELKNSWGKRAGDQGYIKLSYDYVRAYAWDASIAVKLRAPSSGQRYNADGSRDEPSAAPRRSPTAPIQANKPQPVVVAPSTFPPSLSPSDRAQARALGAQLKALRATSGQAASLTDCLLSEDFMDQDRKRYKRQLQLWRLRGLDSANQNAIFECANSSPCVTFEPLDGGSKAPTSWLRASILISGDAAQIALQHQQGVNLWRQLIRVCQAGGGKA